MSVGGGDEEDWSIERLVAGDGSSGRSGVKLHRGRFYGSSSVHGANDTFLQIDFDTLSLRTHGADAVRYLVQAVASMAKLRWTRKRDLEVKIHKKRSPSQRKKVLLHAVKTFFDAHPGLEVILGGTGDRSASHDLTNFADRTVGEIFVRAIDGECLAAGFANAAAILVKHPAAEEAKKALMIKST